MTPAERLASDGFAIVSEDARVQTDDVSDWLPEYVLGDVRLEAGSPSGGDLFLGIARSEDAAAYLAGVRHDVVSDVAAEPEVTWAVEDGSWTAVPVRLAARASTEGPLT